MTEFDDKPGDRAVEVVAFSDENPLRSQDEADWLRGIAESMKPADGYIGAMFGRRAADSSEWRFIAYVGDSWERAGDGFAAVQLTATDPITRRDEAAVRAIWQKCIDDSKAQFEAHRGAA